MADQQGRVAVVTGGGRGLGRAIALGLARAGASVAVVARGQEQLAETVAMAPAGAGEVIALPCDASDFAAVDLVLRLTSDAGAETNGMFCWIDDPLQAPVESWDPPSEERPWMKD